MRKHLRLSPESHEALSGKQGNASENVLITFPLFIKIFLLKLPSAGLCSDLNIRFVNMTDLTINNFFYS